MDKRLLAATCLLGMVVSSQPSLASRTPRIPDCKESQKLIGDCFVVHGRMAFYNGTFNVRVWRIGTKRLLGVALVPDSISKKHPDGIYWMPAELSDTLTFGVQIFGDFDVCPLTRERSGAMQFVCVESAAHLLVKDYNKEPEQTYRLNDTTNR